MAISKNSGQGGFLARVVGAVARKYLKSRHDFAIETMNPLYGMTADRAQMIFNQARSGNYAQLQFLYNEIERTDPTLLVCVSRRAAALSELDWKVVRSDERLNRNADHGLVNAQIQFLEEKMAKIENLPEAVEHLALAAFRGFSHVTPIYADANRTEVRRLDMLDSWNLCFDRFGQRWMWNPDASGYADPSTETELLKPIPSHELVSVVNKTAIDWPALMIFLRSSVGERDWARFLETYGIPPVILTMPQFTNEKEQEVFEKAAEAVYEGGNGVVPYGTDVSYASESRGTNPFSEFLEHQQKLVVLMATGGTLTSLAESGSGTLGGNAQMDVWMQIVRRDVRIIANAINKQLCENLIRNQFKDSPILAEFKFDTSPNKIEHAKEVLELASTANGAGLEMDADELSNEIGFKLARQSRGDEFGGGGMPMLSELRPEPPSAESERQDQDDAPPDTTTPPVAEESPISGVGENMVVATNADKGAGAKPGTPAEKLAAALQGQFRELADRINAILNMPEEEQAGAAAEVISQLDSLVPEDPDMVDAIAEMMASAFERQGLTANSGSSGNTVKNSHAADNDVDPSVENDECHITDHLCRIHDGARIEQMKSWTPDEARKSGVESINKILEGNHEPIPDVMWRRATGPIGFEWGSEGSVGADGKIHGAWGIAHLKAKHGSELYSIPGILAHGAIYKDKKNGVISEDRLAVVSGSRIVILRKDENGSFVMTGFSPDASRYIRHVKKGNSAVEASR